MTRFLNHEPFPLPLRETSQQSISPFPPPKQTTAFFFCYRPRIIVILRLFFSYPLEPTSEITRVSSPLPDCFFCVHIPLFASLFRLYLVYLSEQVFFFFQIQYPIPLHRLLRLGLASGHRLFRPSTDGLRSLTLPSSSSIMTTTSCTMSKATALFPSH